jgi:fucose permease
MWGVGAATGPYVMGFALTRGMGWTAGYRMIGILQVVLTMILIFSLPMWKRPVNSSETGQNNVSDRPLTLMDIVSIKGAKEVMLYFFCYCAIEQTAGLWASSYLTFDRGVSSEAAAGYASMFFIGITVGRALSGFVTMKLNDKAMVRLGEAIIGLGILVIILPFGAFGALTGLVIIGFGCAPVYPCIIHSTPSFFGADRSQAIIGVQMASAYVGTCLMPPLFGVIADKFGIGLLSGYLLVILIIMLIMFEMLVRKTSE